MVARRVTSGTTATSAWTSPFTALARATCECDSPYDAEACRQTRSSSRPKSRGPTRLRRREADRRRQWRRRRRLQPALRSGRQQPPRRCGRRRHDHGRAARGALQRKRKPPEEQTTSPGQRPVAIEAPIACYLSRRRSSQSTVPSLGRRWTSSTRRSPALRARRRGRRRHRAARRWPSATRTSARATRLRPPLPSTRCAAARSWAGCACTGRRRRQQSRRAAGAAGARVRRDARAPRV